MRYSEWTRERWLRFADQSLVAAEALYEQLGHWPDYHYLDTGDFERLRNTVADRSELVSGLVLSAEFRGWIDEGRALVVIGTGPSAIIATQVALAREIPVVQIQVKGRAPMVPLADCHTRWLSPFFYDTLLGSTDGKEDRWEWATPAAYSAIEDTDLRELSTFAYGHERAAIVAERWRAHAERLLARRSELYFAHEIEPLELRTERLAAVHRLATAALTAKGHDIGLIMHCRFFDSEELLLSDSAGVPIFASLPYWESGATCRWLNQQGPILISGSGDGALQDFLRACWKWDSLYDSAQRHLRLFKDAKFPSAHNDIILHLESLQEFLRTKWDEIDDERLALGAGGGIKMPAFETNARRERRDWAKFVHKEIETAITQIIDHCESWDAIACRHTPREAFLHTRSSHFGPCYLHNHFFCALTLRLLENAGRSPRLANQPALNIVYRGPPSCDFRNCEMCADAASHKRFAVSGIPDPETILVRHGRYWLDLAATN